MRTGTSVNPPAANGTITVTLQTKDAAGNNLTSGGLIVMFVLGRARGHAWLPQSSGNYLNPSW